MQKTDGTGAERALQTAALASGIYIYIFLTERSPGDSRTAAFLAEQRGVDSQRGNLFFERRPPREPPVSRPSLQRRGPGTCSRTARHGTERVTERRTLRAQAEVEKATKRQIREDNHEKMEKTRKEEMI